MPRPSYEPSHCIVCGHTDAEIIARDTDLRSEVEWLWAFHEKRLRQGTPPDRLMDRVAFSEHPPFRLVRCNDCGLVYRNPIERRRELAAIYAGDAPPPEVLRALHDTQLPALRTQAQRLRRIMHRGGSVLEVGSYVGAFLSAAREEGLAAEGVDINGDVNRFARSMGFAVHDGELGAARLDRTFDAIAIWNTFDQLADPRATMIAASAAVRPGGVLVIRVPNGDCYYRARRGLASRNPVRRALSRGLLAQNNLLTFPYRWGFTVSALTVLLRDSGFDVTDVVGDVLVPIADEWTRVWAKAEERATKSALRAASRLFARHAPWLEVYARRRLA